MEKTVHKSERFFYKKTGNMKKYCSIIPIDSQS